ncbi:MAG: hypothetical protein ACYS47_12945, partial [Planctomycetota bacterium]
PLRDGVPPACTVAGEDEEAFRSCLAGVRSLIDALRDKKLDLWSPLHFPLPHLARASASDPEVFRDLVEDLKGFLLALHEKELDNIRAVQYGLPAAGKAAGTRAWALKLALRSATRLAEKKAAPGELLHLTMPDLFTLAGDGERPLADLLAPLEDFYAGVSEAGLSTGWPLNVALSDMARSSGGEADTFLSHLPRLRDLILALLRNDLSPYPTLEYGVAGAARTLGSSPSRFADGLVLARALAEKNVIPAFLLQEGFEFYADRSDAVWEKTLEFAHGLVKEGADPTDALRYSLPLLWGGREDLEERCEDDLDLLFALALKIHEGGGSLDRTFRRGIPAIHTSCAEPEPHLYRALHIALTLAGHGVDPGLTLELGVPEILYRNEERKGVVERAFAMTKAFAERGIDPSPTLRYGFPEILRTAGKDDAEFERMLAALEDLVITLHEAGIDAKDVLYFDIHSFTRMEELRSEAFGRLLSTLRDLIGTMAKEGVDPGDTLRSGIPACASASAGRPRFLEAALEEGKTVARKGLDPYLLLRYGIPGLVSEIPEEGSLRKGMIESLTAFCTTLAPSTMDLPPVFEHGVPASVRVAGGDPGRLASVLSGLHGAMTALKDEGADPSLLGHALLELAGLSGPDPDVFADLVAQTGERISALHREGREAHALFAHGLPAAASVARGDPPRFAPLLDALASLARRLEGEDVDPSPVLRTGSATASRIAGRDGDQFLALMKALGEFARVTTVKGRAASGALDHGSSVASAVAGDDAAAFKKTLAELGEILADAEAGDGPALRPSDLSRLLPLFHAVPSAWKGLILPILRTHGVRAHVLLETIVGITPFIKEESDLTILREITTQEGVKAWDVMDHLVLHGLQTSAIRSLTKEKAILREFLRTFPVTDAEFYRAFKAIRTDGNLSVVEKGRKIEALRGELDTLGDAVRSGRLTPEQEKSEILPLVLFHIFPPAMTLSRGTYVNLYRRMADHPEHLEVWNPGPELQGKPYPFRRGAYHRKEGMEIDPAPWRILRDVVRAGAGAPLPECTAGGLGREVMNLWGAGRLSRTEEKTAILRLAYSRFTAGGFRLLSDPSTVADLMAYKEFLGDSLQDILQEGLDAYRAEDGEAYERIRRARLAPPVKVGKGLVKGVWKTLEQVRSGLLGAELASQRLARQLKEFAVSGEAILEILSPARTPQELREILGRLERGEVKIQPGKETQRILLELCGAELSAMNRELFGDRTAPAKLEYRIAEGGPSLEVRFEVTKRKAHAVIGYCEGVCVAPDAQLWDRPEFLQVVFWGPGGQAWGGMHLLIVDEEGDRFLILPGVNPSMRLLNLVEPDKVLEACLDYARRLARRWGLKGVWIPTSSTIHSNRMAIRKAIRDRDFIVRRTADHAFSFSPYAYSIREVFEVPPLCGQAVSGKS